MDEKELADLIIYHKQKYYAGEPEISDAAYDALEEKLRQINPNHPVLSIVGTPEGGKIEHHPRMLSCAKAKSISEIINWLDGINSIFVGYKVDGLSLSLIYDNGKLIQAATRGNGVTGDDVSLSVIYIDDIPKVIPDKRLINVRGEVYLKISEFNKIREKYPDLGYSSPRNLATGTLKQKDIKILKERQLNFKAWGLIIREDKLNIADNVKLLTEWGFDNADLYEIKNPTEEKIRNAYEEILQKREELDFEMDGVVFKYNKYEDREKVGVTEHHPKWQIAWKFPNKGSVSVVRTIVWQVGRTGVLTPVAEIEPVELAGSTIKRATLHNADFVELLDIAPGDTVAIERAGDVIPKIISVEVKGEQKSELPKNCPSCNSKLIREGVDLKCSGNSCPAQDIQGILYWIKIVDIKGLGEKSIEKLYEKNIITHFADLYSDNLTEDILYTELGVNGKKIYRNINRTRKLPFEKFIAGIGIPTVGPKQAKILAEHFHNIKELQHASVSDLEKIEGIATVTANNIINGINDPNKVERLLLNNFEIIYPEIVDNNVINDGIKVYLTGSVEGYTKKDIQHIVESMGYVWMTTISKKLDMLILGNNPGKSKIEKAKNLNIKIIEWTDFIDLKNKQN